jgi:sterol desaturase/sphingolipid hydroxylase (fatty acid hydroxylase superfamily)
LEVSAARGGMFSFLTDSFSEYWTGTTVLAAAILLMFRGGVCFLIERRQPVQSVSYRKVWWRDGISWVVFTFMVVPASAAVYNRLNIQLSFPAAISGWPFVFRLMLFVLLADLAAYWIHRLNHTKHFWRVHKWHHSPTHMYWLAGVRCSLAQLILVSSPTVLLAPMFMGIGVPPPWIGFLQLLKGTFQNDWMHLNVRWGNKWLEWVIVTPRYHRIHHSDNPAHYGANIAVTFAFWDRLFGTYVDPERVPGPLSYGIGEKVPLIRLALGV